jgi:crotonobetainyl-CoA:carnitine CoA-transferase CaiB-like acyl-CoA transferase
MTAKPLKDVTVLEMGTFITGPAASMLLADLGATVIKIEQPGTGDPFRAFKGGYYSPHFQTYNRNKKSITLDTRTDGDRAILDRLLETADVFIQNFRPGVAARLNVDAHRLRLLNPRLIYASISGFGSEGPDRDRPAFDTVAQAASGFLRLLVNPQHPRVVGPAIADAMTGFYTAQGILAALHERHTTGTGRLVETSMFEAMAHFNLDDFTHLLSADEVMGPYSRPHVSQSYVFACADGKWLALHMSSPPKFWENLAIAVGEPEMLARPEFASRDARIAHYDLRRFLPRRPATIGAPRWPQVKCRTRRCKHRPKCLPPRKRRRWVYVLKIPTVRMARFEPSARLCPSMASV